MGLLIIIAILTTLFYFLHKYVSKNFEFWQERNVPHIKPNFIFGNFANTFLLKETLGQTFANLYNKFDTPYFGIYILNRPSFVVKEPELIRRVLVKDFHFFSDRNVITDTKADSIVTHLLFFSKNPEWKHMKSNLVTALTIPKIKNMFSLMKEVGDNMVKYINQHSLDNTFEAKDLCMSFSTDIVTICAFGIEGQSFQCARSPFKEHAHLLFVPNVSNCFRQVSHFVAHDFVKFFGIPFLDPKVMSFLRNTLHEAINKREDSNLKRGDVMDMIMEIKDQTCPSGLFKYEGDRLLAQVIIFFVAGIDTASTATSFALHELCINQEIQKKLRYEIKKKVDEHRCVNYECVNDIPYLSMVIDETLRKYPLLSFLDRLCLQDYNVPNSNVVIPKGIPVYVPVQALHYDPRYFPNPQQFDPERFSKSNKKKITPGTYLPFGDGPRHCLGFQFARLMIKICIFDIISNFEVLPCSNTPNPVKLATKAFTPVSDVGLPIKFRKLSVSEH